MKLPPIHLLVLDTETTGFVPAVHRVIEFACATIEDGKVATEYEQLISSPGVDEVPPYVQVMTNIKPADLRGKPTFADIFEDLQKLIRPETVIVGQNIKFDLGMLKGEGWDLTDTPWVDTAMLASIAYPELKSYSLGYVSAALKLDHTPKHRALGDVRATIQLLSKCWERLSELPQKDIDVIKEYAARGPVGYRKLFESLSASKAKKAPEWLDAVRHKPASANDASVTIPEPAKGLQLIEEPLNGAFLGAVVNGAKAGTWIAVKNLEATMRRIPSLKDGVVLLPPEFILSKKAEKTFLAQKALTADELTLAIKLHLYEPVSRAEVPIHGDEHQVWMAKLACSREDAEYSSLLTKAIKGPALIGHHEVLALAELNKSPVSQIKHLIIDDASMLEDTGTQALGWTCLLPTLRAASQGHEILTKIADLVELWAEKVRNSSDVRYLMEQDITGQEATQLKKLLKDLETEKLPLGARRAVDHLLLILDPQNLAGRITWVECFQDGNKSVKSVPENIAGRLKSLLFDSVPTTLLIPKGGANALASIVPAETKTSVLPITFTPHPLTLQFEPGATQGMAIKGVKGKIAILLGSKRSIEDVYVKYAAECEEKGVTLLCQGFNGGQSRMQAEFAVAGEPGILVTTPWTYETFELPLGQLSTLVFQSLPFDHPSHAVFSRRAERYKDPFREYSLPRLKHRLFRLVRTFARHSKPGSIIKITDDRLTTKAYGKEVREYLIGLIGVSADVKTKEPDVSGQMSEVRSKPKQEGQMKLL